MWTSTLDLSPRRVLLTQLLGRFWRGAYLSSFAPLRVENTPRQQLPGSQWVRVRNRLAGICGSDLHLITADGDLRVAPAALPGHKQTYLGHEVVGEVIEIGDDVQRVHIGDRVVLQHGMNCISAGVTSPCRSCTSGNYALCEYGSLPGPYPIGGGWSEEMILHEQQLFRLPEDMTDEQGVLLEPTSVAVHAVLRRVPEAGERVLIAGAGTIGLLTLQVIRAISPDAEISVLARYPFQVEKATRMGASHIIYPQDSYKEVQRVTQAQLYDGMLGNRMLLGGYDVIYDTIGSQGTIHNALRWTRAKGTIVLVGLNLHFMNIDLSPIWYQEINLIGTMGQGIETWPRGTCEPRSTFDVASDLILQEQLHPEQLITHHFALSNYKIALQTAMDKRQGRTIKVVFDYSMQPASVVPNVRASASTASTRLKQHITTTLAPQPVSTPDEHEMIPMQSSYRSDIPTPITPVHAVPSITPIVPSSTPDTSPVVSTQLETYDITDNDESSPRPSWEIYPSIGIAPPMPVAAANTEAPDVDIHSIQDEDTTIRIESLNGYHTDDLSDEISEQNGYHQQVTPDEYMPEFEQSEQTEQIDQAEYVSQEETYYTFYTPEEEVTIEQTRVPLAENELVADTLDEQQQHDEQPAHVPELENSDEPSVARRFIAPIEPEQPDEPPVEEQFIAPMEPEQPVEEQFIAPDDEVKSSTTTKPGTDKAHNRPKRRKKTHYLVLPQHPDDTDATDKES